MCIAWRCLTSIFKIIFVLCLRLIDIYVVENSHFILSLKFYHRFSLKQTVLCMVGFWDAYSCHSMYIVKKKQEKKEEEAKRKTVDALFVGN